MNLISNYPKKSPYDSFYIPLDSRRECLSLVDCIADFCIKQAREEYQKKYTDTDTDIFDKEISLKVINSAILSAKNELKKIIFPLIIRKKLKIAKKKIVKKITNNTTSLQIYEKVELIFFKWVKKIHLENPLVEKKAPFQLNIEDFKIAQADYESYLLINHKPVCFDFAFYALNEVKAFPYIFQPDSNDWPQDFFLKPINFLYQWGYEVVKNPAPGDLVVYCSTLKGFLQAKHWGIWTQNKKVLSKCGNGEFLEHPICDVIIGYGNFAYFLHKKVKCFFAKKFLKRTYKARKALHNFSYPACYSPLTPLGCIKKMIEIFEKVEMKKVLTKSIYNAEYNEQFKLRVKEDIFRIVIAMDSKEKIIQRLIKIILTQSEKVKGKI